MAYSDADLTELRQQFSDDTAEWQPIREEGAIDMRHVAGDPWDPKDRKAREDAGRPCLSLDELGQYTNQVVNEVRANKRAVKFTPVGRGATEDTAAFYADKMREIEYRSRAQIAYTTAFENAVQRSYGFCRVNTRYESPRSVNQDIWIDPVHNPDLITPDPYALMPDFSDMKHCWVREPWRIEDFNRRWSEHKIEGKAHTDLSKDTSGWVTDRLVWVSEHWKIRTTRRKLLIVQPQAPPQPGSVLNLRQAPAGDPTGMFEDEIQGPVPGIVIGERMVDDPKVWQCLTNGVEILEETAWPGKYIPIIGCVGKVLFLDVDGQGSTRQILSMIRLARDPFMAYCFYRTSEIENVGMSTKNPYWAYEGQLDPTQTQDIQKSMHEPVAVLVAKAMTEATGNQLLPLPVRNVSEPAIQALSMGAEEMRRAVQSAMGQSPLPTSAQRRNEKSGIALKHIEETGQRGAFHFTDHYLDMITHVGVIVEDLMDQIYDTPREVGIRKPNDTAEIIRINDPSKPNAISTKGDHLVTVSTGPSFESERDAASEFADTLAQISPEVFALLGPLIVKLKNLGPVGDEIIELLETVQPPQVQALKASKAEQGDPQQMAKQLMQAQAQLQQLTQVAQQMKQALETDHAKQQATVEKTKIDTQTQIVLQHMKNATAIRVAELTAATKGYALEAAHEQEHEALALGHAHETHEADADRAHEVGMAALSHDQAVQQAQQAHAQGLEAGQQGIDGQMAVQAAAPPPKGTL